MNAPDRIQITHAQPMITPHTALTSDDIPPGPLSEDDLRRGWNQQADEYNQWESLGFAEQLAWAQASAIAADRARATLKAEPEGPSLADVDGLCANFGLHYDDDQGETLEMLRDMISASLARWGHPNAAAPEPGKNLATPPAPQAGEVALAGDRRSAESLQLAHESCRLFGIKNGDCPDSEICWLDLLPCSHYENCATIPASQSGEGEA